MCSFHVFISFVHNNSNLCSVLFSCSFCSVLHYVRVLFNRYYYLFVVIIFIFNLCSGVVSIVDIKSFEALIHIPNIQRHLFYTHKITPLNSLINIDTWMSWLVQVSTYRFYAPTILLVGYYDGQSN